MSKKSEYKKKQEYWMRIRKLNKNNPTVVAKREKRIEAFLKDNPDYLSNVNKSVKNVDCL